MMIVWEVDVTVIQTENDFRNIFPYAGLNAVP
jgi:hypothetical protein